MTTPTVISPGSGSEVPFALLPAEIKILALVLAAALAAVLLVFGLERRVNWLPFALSSFLSISTIALGICIRVRLKSAPRLALCSIGFGLFFGFLPASTLFIYALLPLERPMIDTQLIRVDMLFGYYWPGFVKGLAAFPTAAKALAYVYHSSFLQLFLTILLLGSLGRAVELHRFLLAGILTLAVVVFIWWLWPSVGPSAYFAIPPQTLDATGLVFYPEYGALLLSLVKNGPEIITPEIITGIIAFPSYHIIMASIVVWYTRGTLGFWPAVLVNLAMIIATLSHGAHHMIDLIAGVIVFAIGAWVTSILIPQKA